MVYCRWPDCQIFYYLEHCIVIERISYFFHFSLTSSSDHLMVALRLVVGRLLVAGACSGIATRSFAVAAKTKEMAEKNAKSVYEFTVKNASGEDVSLEIYRGNVLLIVNIASLCGLTAANYKELVELDEKYREAGLRILAFPCNQFGKQEPGNNEEIVCFAKKNNANFDIFDKIDVNGANAHPLYNYLKNAQSGWFGNGIKWNFTKFLVNKQGVPVERHAPTTNPSKLIPSIEKYLAE